MLFPGFLAVQTASQEFFALLLLLARFVAEYSPANQLFNKGERAALLLVLLGQVLV